MKKAGFLFLIALLAFILWGMFGSGSFASHEAGMQSSGGGEGGRSSGVAERLSSEGDFRSSRRVADDKIESINRRVDYIVDTGQNMALINGSGVTPSGKETLDLTESDCRAVSDALGEARLKLNDVIADRLVESGSTSENNVRYKVGAFPEAVESIEKSMVSKISPVCGESLANLAVEALKVDPRFLGFGDHDIIFEIRPVDKESGTKHPDQGEWVIYHEERLPRSGEVVTKNTWTEKSFQKYFDLFEF